MFSQLMPKLFYRNFVIGYFLPITLFFSALIGYFSFVVKDNSIILFIKEDLLVRTIFLGLVFWFGGLLLVAINGFLIRFLEGYYYFPWKNKLTNRHKRRFKELQDFLSDWKEKYKSNDPNIKKKAEQKMTEAIEKELIISERFPDSDNWIMATKFGNSIRAFEVYPRVMYGIDSVLSWNRIVAVMPEDFREIIDNAKANVDFWVNLLVLALIFGMIVFGLYISGISWQGIGFFYSFLVSTLVPTVTMLILVIFFLFCYYRAIEASVEWGDWVKTAFDIYLPKLASSLELELPTSRTDERKFWMEFSQAITYRNPEVLPNRKTRAGVVQPENPAPPDV